MQMNEDEWEKIDINKYLKTYKFLKIVCLNSMVKILWCQDSYMICKPQIRRIEFLKVAYKR